MNRATATHCANGHAWKGNAYYRYRPGETTAYARECRACKRASQRAYAARYAAARKARHHERETALAAMHPPRRSLSDYAREFAA